MHVHSFIYIILTFGPSVLEGHATTHNESVGTALRADQHSETSDGNNDFSGNGVSYRQKFTPLVNVPVMQKPDTSETERNTRLHQLISWLLSASSRSSERPHEYNILHRAMRQILIGKNRCSIKPFKPGDTSKVTTLPCNCITNPEMIKCQLTATKPHVTTSLGMTPSLTKISSTSGLTKTLPTSTVSSIDHTSTEPILTAMLKTTSNKQEVSAVDTTCITPLLSVVTTGALDILKASNTTPDTTTAMTSMIKSEAANATLKMPTKVMTLVTKENTLDVAFLTESAMTHTTTPRTTLKTQASGSTHKTNDKSYSTRNVMSTASTPRQTRKVFPAVMTSQANTMPVTSAKAHDLRTSQTLNNRQTHFSLPNALSTISLRGLLASKNTAKPSITTTDMSVENTNLSFISLQSAITTPPNPATIKHGTLIQSFTSFDEARTFTTYSGVTKPTGTKASPPSIFAFHITKEDFSITNMNTKDFLTVSQQKTNKDSGDVSNYFDEPTSVVIVSVVGGVLLLLLGAAIGTSLSKQGSAKANLETTNGERSTQPRKRELSSTFRTTFPAGSSCKTAAYHSQIASVGVPDIGSLNF